MSEDLVEVVARAIFSEQHSDLDYGLCRDATQENYRLMARAAISAINASGIAKVAPVVATNDMLDAANARMAADGDDPWMSDLYAAMISAVEG